MKCLTIFLFSFNNLISVDTEFNLDSSISFFVFLLQKEKTFLPAKFMTTSTLSIQLTSILKFEGFPEKILYLMIK